MPDSKWPQAVWLLRHAESAGNVARDTAEAAGLAVIEIAQRDMDVPLSPLGRRQAGAVGRWLGHLPPARRPTAVLTSPYLRARDTAQLALAASSIDAQGIPVVVDERLREREFGVLDGLTRAGIGQRHPEQAELRARLGKFYHRPPGGESWCDVLLRLRSVLDTLTRDYRGERVLVVTHQVVVLMFRYLLERMTEAQILTIDREQDLANCSITSYELDEGQGRQGRLVLRHFNMVNPLVDEGETITKEADAPVGPR